jgi:hypothetical protein
MKYDGIKNNRLVFGDLQNRKRNVAAVEGEGGTR